MENFETEKRQNSEAVRDRGIATNLWSLAYRGTRRLKKHLPSGLMAKEKARKVLQKLRNLRMTRLTISEIK